MPGSNLYTLEGGIANYLRQEGSELWDGSLFVFDGRMAIPPGAASTATAVPQFCVIPAGVIELSLCAPGRLLTSCLHRISCQCNDPTDLSQCPFFFLLTLVAGKDAEEGLPAAAACQLCSGDAQLPHVNCANIDCNKLFVACHGCKVRCRTMPGPACSAATPRPAPPLYGPVAPRPKHYTEAPQPDQGST